MIDATPGRDRVITFTINGHEFGFRRPSRADSSEISRRFIYKLSLAGDTQSADMLNAYDGAGLLWESRLEVCLANRMVNSKVIDSGEKAPAHWKFDGEISFHDVEDSEFRSVTEYISSAVFSNGDDEEINVIKKQIELLEKRKELLEAKKK